MVRDVRKNVTQCPRMFMLLYTLSINVFKRRFVSPFLITNTDRALENEESARIFSPGFEHCSLVDLAEIHRTNSFRDMTSEEKNH